MTNQATPNLPSRNFDVTETFYAALGFSTSWKEANWMILRNDQLILEFFHHPELDPLSSWFSCCLRLDDLDGFYARCLAAEIGESEKGHPRLHAPTMQAWGSRMGALIDPDGTLVRLIQN